MLDNEVYIEKEKLEKLISEGLSEKDISCLLHCSSKTIHNNLKKYKLKTKFTEKITTCKNCGCKLNGTQLYFCSEKCKIEYYNKCPMSTCIGHEQTIRGRKKRQEIIQYKGGRCEKCGYCKNSAALSFHHLDINTKSFDINTRKCYTFSYNKLKQEADKCILLCHNCHMELHYPDCLMQ